MSFWAPWALRGPPGMAPHPPPKIWKKCKISEKSQNFGPPGPPRCWAIRGLRNFSQQSYGTSQERGPPTPGGGGGGGGGKIARKKSGRFFSGRNVCFLAEFRPKRAKSNENPIFGPICARKLRKIWRKFGNLAKKSPDFFLAEMWPIFFCHSS